MNYFRTAIPACAAILLACNVSAQSSFSTSGLDGEPRSGQATNGDGIVLTQNTDPTTIIPANSVSCSAMNLHADNSYLRRFDLDGEFALGEPITVDSVDIGVETATSGTGGDQPISIIVHSIANADAFTFGNLVEIGRLDTLVADATQTIVNFPVSSTAINPASDDLVVEVFTPNGQDVGHSFFIGSNAAGQTNPTFLSAPDCNLDEPAPTGDIGFPDMHMVMSVLASVGGAPPPPPPEATSVPTLSRTGLGIMLLIMALVGIVAVRRGS